MVAWWEQDRMALGTVVCSSISAWFIVMSNEIMFEQLDNWTEVHQRTVSFIQREL